MRHSDGSISVFCDEVSIHASVKDATYADDVPDPDKNVSIHASVKDATFYARYGRRDSQVSIHASVKDATIIGTGSRNFTLFQSTHL